MPTSVITKPGISTKPHTKCNYTLQTSISLLGGLKWNFVDIYFSIYYLHRISCSVIKYLFPSPSTSPDFLPFLCSSPGIFFLNLLILSTPRVQKKVTLLLRVSCSRP